MCVSKGKLVIFVPQFGKLNWRKPKWECESINSRGSKTLIYSSGLFL